jgi:hypothetical protein
VWFRKNFRAEERSKETLNKSFFVFNQSNPIEEKFTQLESKVNNMKLMYRKPNSETYENITQALDELYNKIHLIEDRLTVLEDIHFDCGK